MPHAPATHVVRKLASGLRIIAASRPGFVSSLALLAPAGLRSESSGQRGCSALLEGSAFFGADPSKTAAVSRGCVKARDSVVWYAESARWRANEAARLLLQNVRGEQLPNEEYLQNLLTEAQGPALVEKSPGALLLQELLHQTAWEGGLGHTIFDEADLDDRPLREQLQAFRQTTCHPGNLIFSGVNVDADQLESAAEELFPAAVQTAPTAPGGLLVERASSVGRASSPYRGGFASYSNPQSELTHAAVAFRTPGGASSANYMPLAIVQSLLGGGSSFSAGGPGKGMHTRLYQQVLSLPFVDACAPMNHQYEDDGIFGLGVSLHPLHSKFAVPVLLEQLANLRRLDGTEVRRAKAALKASTVEHFESRLAYAEELGRQLMLRGHVAPLSELCAAIDSVEKRDLELCVEKLLASPLPPTCVVIAPPDARLEDDHTLQEYLADHVRAIRG